MTAVRARAPGRVNIIGDHTDYSGGLVLPMAIQLETVVEGVRGGERVALRSDDAAGDPNWARYPEAVAAELGSRVGFEGRVRSTLPIGAGLSSSAALEVAVALALGYDGGPLELAQLCQRAEHRASGVPCGIMDQLVIAAARPGCALLIDCGALSWRAVPWPQSVGVIVVHSGEPRRLAASAYADRCAQTMAAAAQIGPLADASLTDVDRLDDAVLQRRARHVVSENERVRTFVDALEGGRTDLIGDVLRASHASLRDDFEVSTPALDALVDRLEATPGVLGARLTGAGFGGCAVALVEAGMSIEDGWAVTPAGAASVEYLD